MTPTIAALRDGADEVVERVLAENEQRWEALTDADRERLQARRGRSPRACCTSRPCG